MKLIIVPNVRQQNVPGCINSGWVEAPVFTAHGALGVVGVKLGLYRDYIGMTANLMQTAMHPFGFSYFGGDFWDARAWHAPSGPKP